jgi:hypothetical protein
MVNKRVVKRKDSLAVASIQMQCWCVCGDAEVCVESKIPRSKAVRYFSFDALTGRPYKEFPIGSGRPTNVRKIRAIFKKHLARAVAEIMRCELTYGEHCHKG